jgi:hypothetical protein
MVFNFFGNATDNVSWVPNPTTRGTSNILQSCLLTTSLCVWTAVHLNLKEHDNPTFFWISYHTWRKFGWLILGLLAPEILVYTAWYQRSEAKKFRDSYNEQFGLTPTPGLIKRVYRHIFRRAAKIKRQPWTKAASRQWKIRLHIPTYGGGELGRWRRAFTPKWVGSPWTRLGRIQI